MLPKQTVGSEVACCICEKSYRHINSSKVLLIFIQLRAKSKEVKWVYAGTLRTKNTRSQTIRYLSCLLDSINLSANYCVIKHSSSVWFWLCEQRYFSHHRCFSFRNVLPRSLARDTWVWLLPGQQDAADEGSWLEMPVQSEAGGVIVKPSLSHSHSLSRPLSRDKAIRLAGEKPAQRSSSHSPDPDHEVQAKSLQNTHCTSVHLPQFPSSPYIYCTFCIYVVCLTCFCKGNINK